MTAETRTRAPNLCLAKSAPFISRRLLSSGKAGIAGFALVVPHRTQIRVCGSATDGLAAGRLRVGLPGERGVLALSSGSALACPLLILRPPTGVHRAPLLDHKTSISAVSGSVGGAAYVLRPDGTTKRRPVYGKSEEIVRGKLTELQANSDQGIPADATGWTVERYLTVWLAQTVKPNRQSNTYVTYEKAVRIYLVPGLGRKRLNRLTGADVRQFIRRTESTCRCCARGVDKERPEGERRCCAVGRCCRRLPSKRQVQVVHAVLRNALQAAVREELVGACPLQLGARARSWCSRRSSRTWRSTPRAAGPDARRGGEPRRAAGSRQGVRRGRPTGGLAQCRPCARGFPL